MVAKTSDATSFMNSCRVCLADFFSMLRFFFLCDVFVRDEVEDLSLSLDSLSLLAAALTCL